MSTSSTRRSFAAHYSDSSDKLLLGGAFLFGIVGSIGLKFAGLPVIFPAIFSGLVIILYAVFTYFSRSARLEPDQIGDNAYYLGFVLTLSSLSYTLYELGTQDTEAVFIAQVISGFGIALSSTIVGVATRVLLIQFRTDLVARDREAKLSLNQAMRSFRSEMADSIRGTKYLGAEIRQTLEEHHDAIAAGQEARMSQGMASMMESFKASLEGLLTESRSTQQALAETNRTTVTSAEEHVNKTLNRLQESLTVAAGRICDGMLSLAKATEDGISANREVFGQQIAATLAAAKSADEALASSREGFASQIAATVAMAKTADEGLTSSREAFARQIAATANLQETSNRAVVTSAENLRKMVSSVLAKAAADAGRDVQIARDDIAQTSAVLKGAIGTMKVDVAEFAKVVKTHTTALAKVQAGHDRDDRRQEDRIELALGTMVTAMDEMSRVARLVSVPDISAPRRDEPAATMSPGGSVPWPESDPVGVDAVVNVRI